MNRLCGLNQFFKIDRPIAPMAQYRERGDASPGK